MCMMQYNVHRNQSRAHIYWYPCSKYFSLYHNDKMKFFHYYSQKKGNQHRKYYKCIISTIKTCDYVNEVKQVLTSEN